MLTSLSNRIFTLLHSTTFEIKLEKFEGPFDLLLFFIERDELNIHDIPISKITHDFLDYLAKLQSLDIELASEFIFVAATLMRIKSRMLLPQTSVENEEFEEDPREDLVKKLLLYKQFKDIAEVLKVFEAEQSQQYIRGSIDLDLKSMDFSSNIIEDLEELNLFSLMNFYENAMRSFDKREVEHRHTIIKYPYSIEQQKTTITSLLELNHKLDFQTVLKNSENKVQFVYNLLAILELLQQELLEIELGLGFNNFSIKSKLAFQSSIS